MTGKSKYLLFACCFLFLFTSQSYVFSETKNILTSNQFQEITKIQITGNKTLSEAAVINFLSFKLGDIPTLQSVRQNIKNLLETGYFSDVHIAQKPDGTLIVTLREKPTLRQVRFEGFNAVSSSSLNDKLITKSYSILDEKKVSQDLKTIDQAYVEKGYYLAKTSFELKSAGGGAFDIIFIVKENTPLTVRQVNLLGNEFFSNDELKSFMLTKSYTWLSFMNSSGIFRDEFLEADQNNLAYFYRDNGFAEATVSPPMAILDRSKTNVDVSFYIEQGERFKIGKIHLTGELITSENEIKKILSLNEGDDYRISKFSNDMRILKNYYGDRGYAFVYVYPSLDIDRKNKTYDVTYNITPGPKVYFRRITITGNDKTRDNVIRRALKISEGQLFHATDLERSKREIEYIGFFSKVEIVENSDQKNGFVDVKIFVEEKSTGQFRASLGASPQSFGGGNFNIFGDLMYRERNMLGRGYGLSVNLQASPSQDQSGTLNWTVGLDFTNPSVYDSAWNFGVSGSYNYQLQSISQTSAANPTNVYIKQKSILANATIGREIIEHLRFTLGYSYANYLVTPSVPLIQNFYNNGTTEEFTQSLVYDLTDDSASPTSGLYISAYNALGLRWIWGDYNYGSFTGNIAYYLPVYYTKGFKTNFRFVIMPRYIYKTNVLQNIPYWKRLTLGNMFYMKGYTKPGETLSPTVPITISPVTGQAINMITGGNRSFYGALEYFVPLIPEIGLKFVMFGEGGIVLDDNEFINLNGMKYDVGFGLRWVTSVAPFRFEWAFPVEKGHLGASHFVFTVGFDSTTFY